MPRAHPVNRQVQNQTMKKWMELLSAIAALLVGAVLGWMFSGLLVSSEKSEKQIDPSRSVTLTISNQSGVEVKLYLPTEPGKGQTIVLTNK